MGSVRAEFLKLKRSMSPIVVVLLPLTAVVGGLVNTVTHDKPLTDGWHSLWMRVMVFYGLFPLAVGVAALASLVWRVEHQGGNWNALMGRQVSSRQVVLGKMAVLSALVTAMQVVLVVGVVVLGKFCFDLPGMLPGEYFLSSLAVVVACLPVAALHSGLSMLLRSFAAPIAVALLGAPVGMLLLMLKFEAAGMAVPYGLIARASQLGTGMFVDSGTITAGTVAGVLVCALFVTAVALAGTAAVLDRRDIR